MLNYVIKRLLGLIPTLFIVSVLVFLFVHMLPGDPARLIAGPEADAQVIELVRQQLGLDQPLYHQFWHYISNAVQGDFGLSFFINDNDYRCLAEACSLITELLSSGGKKFL